MDSTPHFRPLRRDELPILLEWAAREGWNPGLADESAFFAADPHGFWAMEREGELIGGASTVVYDGKVGFVGLFIVRPEWRGRGWGLRFWKFFIAQMLERLGPEGGAALDGVFAMQEKYAQSGFRLSHRNLRMEGIGAAYPASPEVQPLASIPWETLLAFDTGLFGAPRPAFLRRWMAPEGGSALAVADGPNLKGYGIIRPCREGFKIGPLFAQDAATADTLFQSLNQSAIGKPLYLDLPENNPDAIALASRYQMREAFGCARMTLGYFPALPWGQIYGVTSFELG